MRPGLAGMCRNAFVAGCGGEGGRASLKQALEATVSPHDGLCSVMMLQRTAQWQRQWSKGTGLKVSQRLARWGGILNWQSRCCLSLVASKWESGVILVMVDS